MTIVVASEPATIPTAAVKAGTTAVTRRRAYQALVEDLRETPFWGTYFEVQAIVPAIENAYARHYDVPAY